MKTTVDFATKMQGKYLAIQMYQGSESGFCVPAVGDLVSFLPEIIEETEFCDLEDWCFRVGRVVRVYGAEQNVNVLLYPVSKTQAESEENA